MSLSSSPIKHIYGYRDFSLSTLEPRDSRERERERKREKLETLEIRSFTRFDSEPSGRESKGKNGLI